VQTGNIEGQNILSPTAPPADTELTKIRDQFTQTNLTLGSLTSRLENLLHRVNGPTGSAAEPGMKTPPEVLTPLPLGIVSELRALHNEITQNVEAAHEVMNNIERLA